MVLLRCLVRGATRCGFDQAIDFFFGKSCQQPGLFRDGQGGVELDFRNATMEGNEAKIDVSALMGGIDIRVPGSWVVINRVSAILGGVDDNTTSHDGNKRLVVEGTVLMGGLDIKN